MKGVFVLGAISMCMIPINNFPFLPFPILLPSLLLKDLLKLPTTPAQVSRFVSSDFNHVSSLLIVSFKSIVCNLDSSTITYIIVHLQGQGLLQYYCTYYTMVCPYSNPISTLL